MQRQTIPVPVSIPNGPRGHYPIRGPVTNDGQHVRTGRVLWRIPNSVIGS